MPKKGYVKDSGKEEGGGCGVGEGLRLTGMNVMEGVGLNDEEEDRNKLFGESDERG